MDSFKKFFSFFKIQNCSRIKYTSRRHSSSFGLFLFLECLKESGDHFKQHRAIDMMMIKTQRQKRAMLMMVRIQNDMR